MAENGLFPVSLERHRNRYWRRFTSYLFADEMDACPIVISEISLIAASFPIVFQSHQMGFSPVSLFSVMSEPGSPFVSQNGRWLAPYVPSALRCFPFQAESLMNGGHWPRLIVDENSGLVSRNPGDNPFFTTDGQLTQDLCDVQLFLQSRQTSAIETEKICSLIAEMDLFVPLVEQDGIILPQGYWGIDAQRLERLPRAYCLTLLSSGALRLIHAHHISLSHCAWLSRVQNQAIANRVEQSDALSGFMTAMFEDVRQGPRNTGVIHEMG